MLLSIGTYSSGSFSGRPAPSSLLSALIVRRVSIFPMLTFACLAKFHPRKRSGCAGASRAL